MTHVRSAPVLLPAQASPGPLRLGRLSRLSRRREQTLWIAAAVLVSLLIHAIAFGLFAVAGRRTVPLPTKDAEVELLMVEQKGAKAASPSPQPTQRPQTAKAQPAKTPPVKPAQAAAKPPPEAPKPQVDKSEAPLPPPAPAPRQPTAEKPQPAPAETPSQDAPPSKAAQADKPAPPAQPTPPSNAQQALQFDLNGTGADSNAEVTGGHVLPASPDDRFRNMPPPYPSIAAEIGAKGTVSVIIHVSPDGLVAGVDIVRSSGFFSLDEAVLSTVRKWRFHPALRNAQAVPFDLPFDFIYRDD